MVFIQAEQHSSHRLYAKCYAKSKKKCIYISENEENIYR